MVAGIRRRRGEDTGTSKPSEDQAEPRGSMTVIISLLPFLWPKGQLSMRVRVVLAMVALVAAKAATVYIPLFYGDAVDALSLDEGETSAAAIIAVPALLIVGYGLVRIGSIGFAQLRDAIFARVGQRAIRTVALSVFRHLHQLSLRFHLERQTGGLSRSVERGTRAIENLLRLSLFNVIPTAIELLMVTAILWGLFDFWFALLTLVTVVTYVMFTYWVTEWRLKFRRIMNEADNTSNTRAIDSLLNYETVKYFSNEGHEAQRLDKALARYEDATVVSQSTLSLLNTGQAAIISVGLAAIMWLAAERIVDGSMEIGGFVVVNTYLIQLAQPLNLFGWVYREIKQSLIDMEKLFNLLDEEREIQDKPDAKEITITGGAITFKDIDFGYDPRRPILRGVSFEVPAGKTVAVVGPSGAGKSTLSRLLYRFYDIGAGAIEIDGQDLRDVTQASVRRSIGIVPQDTVLFNDTVFYNIAYGRPDATPSEVEEAARLAQIHDFIMALPDGYQAIVGERGLKLSGGEKQRVAIARTILKGPPILLFDEATSALDTHTEREIQANLREVSRGRTTLVIAHRLSTIVDADQIIVLEDGRIVERGTHSALLALGTVYAGMWAQQQEAAGNHNGDVVGTPTIAAAGD